ncbi:probable 2' cyclic ADP-D-ribose synthase BdTIR [Amaranthus tricolor]|uniref:probable 2' cyclic ADP-D-ribose synthase BdTIR n=1 Tax=Amaranthus tricolor TaxID=29722 RepID=UPI00258AF356|nr:probable 2' cyclic ADP-D-ribose synthase BdTIR [Amaranthus tricolor]
MQRTLISKCLTSTGRFLRPATHFLPSNSKSTSDIFINHRGTDTKRTIAGLLYHHLSGLGYHPFLDSKSMKPGDNLFKKIVPGIQNCKIGVAIFSQRYCESYFCLHELALMMEFKKKILPIFWDVKPSELRIVDNGSYSTKEIERFQKAIDEVKDIVGITFDTSNGDWSEFLSSATDSIVQCLHETEEDNERHLKHKITKY